MYWSYHSESIPDFPAMIKSVSYLEYMIPTTEVLANAVSNVIEENDVVVMRNHGVLTVGKTMKEAYFLMQILEEAPKYIRLHRLWACQEF